MSVHESGARPLRAAHLTWRQRRPRARAGYGAALRARLHQTPTHAVSPVTGAAGFAAFMGAFLFWPRGVLSSGVAEFFLFIGIVTGAMVAVTLALPAERRRLSAALGVAGRGGAWARVRAGLHHRLVGVAAICAGAWLYYTVVPLYRDPWYARLVEPFRSHIGLFAACLALYVALLPLVCAAPGDPWAAFGRLLAGQERAGDRAEAGELLGGTLVKLFFLPLMLGYALGDWAFFHAGPSQIGSFRDAYDFLYRFLFFIDVVFGLIGYTMSLRLLDSHVRWPERTISGWLVCLVCYAPFWQIIGRDFLSYGDGITWGTLLPENGLIYTLWGGTILLLVACYAASTVSFGLRFSNLTYRGTVAHGPYAYLCHPAYMTKNTAYWMIQIPFIADSPRNALANSCALIGINLVYWLRARHEEACCGRDPDYRLYTRYVRRYSPLLAPARAARRRWRSARAGRGRPAR